MKTSVLSVMPEVIVHAAFLVRPITMPAPPGTETPLAS
jgi:hypothetical protein